MSTVERPEFCTDEMLEYLDNLRESGVTNMFGASPYLNIDFPDELGELKSFSRATEKARKVLAYWMKTFSERHGIAQ